MSTSVYQRDVFIREIFNAATKDRNIFLLSADFGAPALDIFREQLPQQFLHAGISEQNTIDMAAGLALSGKKVYVYAMAPFITLRCIEQTKCSLAIMNLPVTIISVGGGLGYADAGPTHYSTEDIACMRSIVGMEVLSPCDEISTRSLARLTIAHPKLRLVRLERNPLPSIYNSFDEFNDFGHTELRSGGKVCVLSYGFMLHKCFEARKESGNSAFGIVDLYRVKPIDTNLINILCKYDGLVTVEEQCRDGGFGSALLEFISDHRLQIPVERLSLQNRYYFENGGREYLLKQFGLSLKDILRAVQLLTPD